MLKMSGNLVSYFTLLLLLLTLLMSCGGVSGDAAATTSSYTWRTMTDGDGTLSSLRGPSVVNLKDGMVVVAEGHIKKNDAGTEITGIMSRIMENSGGETRTEISLTEDDVKSGTRILEGSLTEGGAKAHNVTRPTTVVTENNIYMLLTKSSAEGQPSGDEAKSLLFVSGTLSEGGAKKQVTWSDTKVATPQSTPAHLKELVTGGGSGIVMEGDNRVAFPIQATKNGKNVLLVMHGSVKDNTWELSTEVKGADGCSDPAIVEWEEGNKFLMITPCAKGSYDVYRSTELGAGWLDTGVPLTRVWGTSQDRSGSGVRSGFITTTFEGRKVLLVTLPVYSENGKGRLHLFLTDNAHVYDVGPVSPEDDNAAASNLLYTNDNKLIVVYEKKNTDAPTPTGLVSVPLTEQLEQIKSVVQTWDKVDKSLKECTSDKKKPCSRDVSTEGLVGFLSGTHTDSEWKDEYLCVNATVKGAEKTDKGLKFHGTGAGAEWPVGKLGQNQPYYFANNQFTLVATVTIHRAPKAGSSPIPLIGVKMNDTAKTVLLGLSYSHDKKWVPLFNNANKEAYETWEENKEYQVVITFKYNEWSVYIDGEEIYGSEEEDDYITVLEKLFEHNRISHFYIGEDGDASNTGEGIDVTVNNVLLYNRELETKDINKLTSLKSVSSLGSVGSSDVGKQSPEGDDPGGMPHQQSEPTAGEDERKEVAPPVKSEGGKEKEKESVAASSDGLSSTTEEKDVNSKQNEKSAESQGNGLPSSDPSIGEEQTNDRENNTTVQEPQRKDEEAPPADNPPVPVKGVDEREPGKDGKGTPPGNSVGETASPESHPPAETKEEADGEEEEEKPSVGGEKEAGPGKNEATADVKEKGNENPNEPTTPSGIDDHGNASSSGTDGASTRDRNNVPNTDTHHPPPDAKNEEALGNVEPAPGARRQGNANHTTASSQSNRTSADSRNTTNSVLHLINNDSTARESASHVFLLSLLFLGLYGVVALS